MNKNQLQKTLATLHSELGSEKKVDDETRDLLMALAHDIQRLSEQDASESMSEVEPLSEQVQDAILKFGSEHPQISRALNQVSAALANLGI